jgi:hypothetical protein
VLSLTNLQGGVVRDAEGSFRIDAPIADPAKPPFVRAGEAEVILAAQALLG